MTTRFEDYCARQRAQFGDKFSPPNNPQFIAAFNNGNTYRVRVLTKYPGGDEFLRWGFLGITTGWSPAFLLMRQRGQHGSSDVLSDRDQIVASKWIK